MKTSRWSSTSLAAETAPISPVRALVHGAESAVVLLVLGHLGLALVLRAVPALATLHAWGTLAVGIAGVLTARSPSGAVVIAAYVAGAEVLWRMTGARVPWEFGKYAISVLFLLAALRFRPGRSSVILPLAYLALLSPSMALTLDSLGPSEAAREQLSFNLSGHLALAVSAMLLLSVSMNERQRIGVLWSAIAPIVGIGAIALSSIASAEDLNFTLESNRISSGGFGPNQVSAILGLGAVLCLLLVLRDRRRGLRLLAAGIGLWLLVQSLLTFSRGGLLNALVCVALIGVHYLSHPKLRTIFIASLSVVLALGSYVILPWVNDLTGGSFESRFTSLDTTYRLELAQADVAVWLANPLLGVGPGLGKIHRDALIGLGAAAHTEFTRLLSEHGVLGLMAAGLLVAMGWQAYRRSPSPAAKAWVAACVGWSLAEMTHSAMRIVAISLIFSFSLMRWPDDADRTD